MMSELPQGFTCDETRALGVILYLALIQTYEISLMLGMNYTK